MRKLLIAIVAGSAAAIAAPSSAQYYSHPGQYGYGGYGNWDLAHTLERRIHNVLRSLDGVRPDQRYEIRAEAINLDRQLRFAASNGLDPYEGHALDVRIGRLERQVQWAASDRGYGYDRYNGYNGSYGDRERYGHEHRWQGNDEDDGD